MIYTKKTPWTLILGIIMVAFGYLVQAGVLDGAILCCATAGSSCAASSSRPGRSWSTTVSIAGRGYHEVTPLRLADSPMRVLVNRGWVPAPADHRVQPTVPPPAGTVELSGIAVVPGTRFFSLAPPPAGWQPVWQNLDLKAYAATVNFPLQPVVVELDAASPHGYAREWPRPDERAERHRSYAMQWFGFAASTIGIWAWFALRRP